MAVGYLVGYSVGIRFAGGTRLEGLGCKLKVWLMRELHNYMH